MKKHIGVLFLLSICLVGCGEQKYNSNEPIVSTENIESLVTTESEITTENEADKELSIEDNMQLFVDKINKNANITLEYIEDFVPSDNSGPHYRTEFRLSAYENAIGKSYSYGSATVDIVIREDYLGEIIPRIYMDNATIEQCTNIINIVSPIMDSTISDAEIQDTINYVLENKEANGYYYGNLGLLLNGSGENKYELMLKMGND